MNANVSANKPLKRPFKYPDKNYFINTGFYFAFKRALNWRNLKWQQVLNKIFISERIIEIPFAIKHLSSLPSGSQVLDLGCVESPTPLMEAALGLKVTGYDFREYPYIHPNIMFKQGDICHLPFADKIFDAVVCLSTIEHLGIGFYDDPKKVEEADMVGMKEINRVLKDKGRLILSAPVGRKQMTGHQRIYDIASFQRLFQNFLVLDQKFFINTRSSQESPNCWQEAEVTQIQNIDDTSGAAVAVGTVAAIKGP
ncbi:MAG: hypothetical protein AMJ95_00515 [Omnitrophica WOR_2 bacterium SM23_72]|nr:MAG: hypothetical protein AMJ95_00515 [Omnitrophica WOR_2 bacterium SM23_72]